MVDVVEGSPSRVSETSLCAVNELVSERGRLPSRLLVVGSQRIARSCDILPFQVASKSLDLGVESRDLLPKGAFLFRVPLKKEKRVAKSASEKFERERGGERTDPA